MGALTGLSGLRGLNAITNRVMPIRKLFHARFSDLGDLAAPLPSPLPCDVGSLTVTDTENKLSIANGALACAGGKASSTYGDPGVFGPALAKTGGRAMLATITPANTTGRVMVGFGNAQNGNITQAAVRFTATGQLDAYINAALIAAIGTFAASTAYEVAIVLRPAGGAFVLIRGGVYITWTFLWVGTATLADTQYPSVANYSAAFTADNLRVVDLGGAWATQYGIALGYQLNPANIVPTLLGAQLFTNPGFDSDTAWTKGSGWTIADNVASHAAGLAGNITQDVGVNNTWVLGSFELVASASGGNAGLTNLTPAMGYKTVPATYQATGYVSNVSQGARSQSSGTVSIDNVTLQAISLPSCLGAVLNTQNSGLWECNPTLVGGNVFSQAGMMLCLDDETNPQNFLLAYHDGTNAALIQCVAGTYSNVIAPTAATYSAGARLIVTRSGNTCTLYYNNTRIGNPADCNAAITGTKHSLFNTYSGNSFTAFVHWPLNPTIPAGA